MVITAAGTFSYLAAMLMFSLAILCVAFAAGRAPGAKVKKVSLQGRMGRLLLLASAIPWLLTGQQLVKQTAQPDFATQLQALPVTAAGVPMDTRLSSTSDPLTLAQIAMVADELASNPSGREFLLLRQRVLAQLYAASSFDEGVLSVSIDLSEDKQQETIKYLAQNRPGLLTVMHQRADAATGPKLIIYFPEVIGNHIIYTPINSDGISNLSSR